MARSPRHFWQGGLVVAAGLSLALPPALAAMTRSDSVQKLSISKILLGEFMFVVGDSWLIVCYAKVSEVACRNFSFMPVVIDDSRKNCVITVVIRARDDASSAARTAALAKGRTAPVAIAPVAYDLGASVGFEKFVTPQLPRGTDLRNLPVARAPEQAERRSRFATRMINRTSDPAGATDRVTAPGETQSVDVVSSYRITRHLDVTAGVRYKADDRLEPLTDARRDSQAVYVGTQFRF